MSEQQTTPSCCFCGWPIRTKDQRCASKAGPGYCMSAEAPA